MKKDLEELLYAYGRATQVPPPEELVEQTKGRLRRPAWRKWLVLAAILVLFLLYTPLVVLLTIPMPLPQLLLSVSCAVTFYNALIIVMWLTREKIGKFFKEAR